MTRRARCSRRLATESLEPRLVLDSTVVFNEIMYNPGDDPQLEWLELHNQLSVNMDLSDWRIEGIGYQFPDGTVLGGRQYLVIAKSPIALQTASGYAEALGPYPGQLAGGGETLRLINNSHRVMDEISYDDQGEWPIGPDGSGASLEKIDPYTTSEPANHWGTSARLGGTPGASSVALSDKQTRDLLLRDFHSTPDGTFLVDLPDGTYTVQLPLGDVDRVRDDLAIRIQGTLVATLSTKANEFVVGTYSLDVSGATNGQLALRLEDQGGQTGRAAVNALTITSEIGGNPWRFDFGVVESPVPKGYTQVTESDIYSAAVGYGWQPGTVVDEIDRGPFVIDPILIDPIAPTAAGPVINEVAPGGHSFWLEIANPDSQSVNLGGQVIASSQAGTSPYVFPEQTLPAGGFLQVTEAELRFGARPGDRIFYYLPRQEGLIDAIRVDDTLRGRSQEHNGQWLFPDVASPGAGNLFSLTHDIVINEIMYHYRPDAPARPTSLPVPPADGDLAFDFGTADSPVAWGYIGVAGDAYDSTVGYGWSDGDLSPVDRTSAFDVRRDLITIASASATFAADLSNGTYFVTVLMGDADKVRDQMQLRFEPGEAGELTDEVTVLAGEYHRQTYEIEVADGQLNLQLSDLGGTTGRAVINGLLISTSPLGQDTPVSSAGEEWIELYNRSATETIDLSSWKLADAISFDFPQGIQLGPGEYLVVAKHAAALQIKYPALTNIIGDFSGKLSNQDERILLLDAQLNPADEVHYYEGGRWPQYADGGGSSLELRSPNADNSKAAAWAASDETGKSEWTTHSFRKDSREPLLLGSGFNEFVFGLLDSGEVLLDDISVLREPSRLAAEMIQDGTFELDRIEQDFHSTPDGVFLVDLPEGMYDLHLVSGDLDQIRDDVVISVQGNVMETLTTQAGEAVDRRYTAIVDGTTNGQLAIHLEDTGGATDRGVINGLEITPSGGGVPLRFDFGTPDSPVELNYTAVTVEDVYRPQVGYGWSEGTILAAKDRHGTDTWRLIGNHSGGVVADPDDPGNKVLHVIASGPQQHVHDHIETTFVDNTSILNRTDYQISFRAKWLAGSRLLNSRLYFTRLGNTAVLPVPELSGTPGSRNSRFETNIGPTYSEFGHSPVLPADGQPVIVSVLAEDPDGVASLTLWWNDDDGITLPTVPQPGPGPTWNSVAMTPEGNGRYTGTIPGQERGKVVQFYVEGRDALGVLSTFPAAGVASRALYLVGHGPECERGPGRTSLPIDTFRLVMLSADQRELFPSRNGGAPQMTNNLVGTTLIHGKRIGENITHEVFYDIGVRQTGSRWIRPNSGYKVVFDSEKRFYGVHSSIRFDLNNLREIWMKQLVNRAGGSDVSMYDDVGCVISSHPNLGDLPALVQFARYTNVFLDEQFENGSDGTLWELDDIVLPSNPRPFPEGEKKDTQVAYQDIQYRGDDPEAYRGQLLIKNNRAKDDYGKIVEFARAINLRGQELFDATQKIMDVDLWMRHYATQAFLGNWNTYGDVRAKNLRFYLRPADQKFIPFFWDADMAHTGTPLVYRGGDSRLDDIRDLPANWRLFWGHMWDLIDRAFNGDYLTPWGKYYATLTGENYSTDINRIIARVTQARSRARSEIPQLSFQITTNRGNPYSVNKSAATIDGVGWIDVREIRLAGSDKPLDVTWTHEHSWQVTLSLRPGTNDLTFEAIGFRGNLLATDRISVESAIPDRPQFDSLRITEINFDPYDPSGSEMAAGFDRDDDFEFVELINVGPSTVDLAGARFIDGITFDFTSSAGVSLDPGQRILIVEDIKAFEARYGPGLHIAGQWMGGLSGSGETLTLVDSEDAVILSFTYGSRDPWPSRADGKGATLEVIDTEADYGDPENWRSSNEYGGSPGTAGTGPIVDVLINEILQPDDGTTSGKVELFNPTTIPIDLSDWYVSDDDNDLFKSTFPHGTTIYPNEYLVLDETSLGISLDGSQNGDLWIVQAEAGSGKPVRFVDHVTFHAADSGVSLGRWPDADPTATLFPLLIQTLGFPNSGPVVSDVVISEIHYNPTLFAFEQDFSDETSTGLTPQLGTWNVTNGRYEVTPGELGDTVATIDELDSLTRAYRIATTLHIPSDSGFNKNAAVIFDYQGPTDFKFASVHVGAGELRIGHRDETGWNFLAEVSATFPDNTDHSMALEIDGFQVTLSVNANEKLVHEFASPLSDGQLGVGSKNGVVWFDDVSVQPLNEEAFEFIELANRAQDSVDLTGWELDDAIQFSFHPGTVMGPATTLVVVGFDPSRSPMADAFREEFDIDASVPLAGPYSGKLRNSGEAILLLKALDPGNPITSLALVDRVNYDDQDPWPVEADGMDQSLHRVVLSAFSDRSSSWTSQDPTPGTTAFAAKGDLNLDGVVNSDDIEAFVLGLKSPSQYEDTYHVPPALAGDTDVDGDLDFDDVDDFVVLIGNLTEINNIPLEKTTTTRSSKRSLKPDSDSATESVVDRPWDALADAVLMETRDWIN